MLAVATVVLLVVGPTTAAGAVGTGELPGQPVTTASATQNVTGHPSIQTSVPQNKLVPGEQTSLSIILFNDGNVTNGSMANPQLEERVTNARGVRVRVEDDFDAPVTIDTNERFLAALPDGQSAPVQFALTVDGDAEPGEYTLPVNISYNYTERINPETGESNSTTANKTVHIPIEITETARFAVVDVESNARIGATGTVNVTLENTGSETARNGSVALTSQNTDLTFGGSPTASRYVGGAWEPGERRTISYRVSAARSASQQEYSFSAQVTYENSEGNTRQSRSLSLGVTPAPEQTFSVVSVDNSVEIGEEGTVTLQVRNDGPIAVDDATVRLQSSTGEVVFGESTTASQYVGAWAPGQTREIAVNATALAGAEVRNYSMTATVDYEDSEGDASQSRPLQFGFRPAPEQSVEFASSNVSSTLRVGAEGTLTGTITNTGEETASNVVVVFESQSQTVTPLEREAAVGTLGPGESATFEFDVEVASSGNAGQRQFTLRPQYRDDDDAQRQGESFDVRQAVAPERDVFAVSVVNDTVEQGGNTLLEVAVTNNGDEPLSDISAQVFTDDPISVVDGEAFVGSLDPGAETTLTFEISAGSGALVKAYPVDVDFQYTEPDGDRKLSDTYKLSVDVTEREEEGGLPVLPIAAVAVVVLALAAVAYRTL
jgi:hypothetical protein